MMLHLKAGVVGLLLAVASGGLPAAAATTDRSVRTETELAFSRVLEALRKGQRQVAEVELAALLEQAPNFRAAQWLQSEMYRVLAGARPDGLPVDEPPELEALREELRQRAEAEAALPPDGYWPDAVMAIADLHRHLIVVDLALGRLYVMEHRDGQLRVLRHHYASIGRNGTRKRVEGDLRTPVGVYHVTQWIDGKTLPDLYGTGAFPVDYPNAWDRFLRRTGYGIWLHGVPRATYTRAPQSSEGCVTMANEDLTALQAFIDVGQTPVVLSDELRWLPADEAAREQQTWRARIEDWRSRWSSVDTDGYLALYHPEFSTPKMDRAAFAAHKRRVNAGKAFIEVTLQDLSLWRYPGVTQPMVLAEFTQHYRSNNFSSVTQKQQYWQQMPDGSWTIFREVNR